MEERKLNISKIVATILIIVFLVALIIFLTKYLTNKKEAAYVSSNSIESSTNVGANTAQENVWEISTNSDIKENNIIVNNVNQENTIVENNTNQENNIAQNNINQENNTVENNKKTDTITDTTTNTTTNISTENKENTVKKEETKKQEISADTTDVKGVIWLTFDDGPNSKITPKILDILKKENVKATFFILNYTDANEALIKREVSEGHTVAIHGYSHEYSKIYKSKEAFWNNVYTLQNKIQKSTGIKTMYLRFPGGSSNTVSRKYCKGIMTELTKQALEKGFKYFDWNISSGDAGGAKTSKDVYRNVTKNLSKKRGNLVLCHDIHKITLDALEDIIKYGKKNGYIFKAIDDNTPMYAQHINN